MHGIKVQFFFFIGKDFIGKIKKIANTLWW